MRVEGLLSVQVGLHSLRASNSQFDSGTCLVEGSRWATLGDRLTAGHEPLKLAVEVRILLSQPFDSRSPFAPLGTVLAHGRPVSRSLKPQLRVSNALSEDCESKGSQPRIHERLSRKSSARRFHRRSRSATLRSRSKSCHMVGEGKESSRVTVTHALAGASPVAHPNPCGRSTTAVRRSATAETRVRLSLPTPSAPISTGECAPDKRAIEVRFLGRGPTFSEPRPTTRDCELQSAGQILRRSPHASHPAMDLPALRLEERSLSLALPALPDQVCGREANVDRDDSRVAPVRSGSKLMSVHARAPGPFQAAPGLAGLVQEEDSVPVRRGCRCDSGDRLQPPLAERSDTGAEAVSPKLRSSEGGRPSRTSCGLAGHLDSPCGARATECSQQGGDGSWLAERSRKPQLPHRESEVRFLPPPPLRLAPPQAAKRRRAPSEQSESRGYAPSTWGGARSVHAFLSSEFATSRRRDGEW